jgi:hypothetical protein
MNKFRYVVWQRPDGLVEVQPCLPEKKVVVAKGEMRTLDIGSPAPRSPMAVSDYHAYLQRNPHTLS